MRIRINNENGDNLGECEFLQDENQDLKLATTNDCIDVNVDIEQGLYGFDYAIDLYMKDMITPERLDMEKALVNKWAIFTVLRTEYDLDIASDYTYVLEILQVPEIYEFISEETYLAYIKELKDFLELENEIFSNDKYTYEELDNFIHELNPIYKI